MKCQWCDKEIVKDKPRRMWTALPADRARFYCPDDPDQERSQHIPVGPVFIPDGKVT